MSSSGFGIRCWEHAWRSEHARHMTDVFTPPGQSTPAVQSAHADVLISHVHLQKVRTEANPEGVFDTSTVLRVTLMTGH